MLLLSGAAKVPASHHVLRGGLAPEAARDQDLLGRRRLAPDGAAVGHGRRRPAVAIYSIAINFIICLGQHYYSTNLWVNDLLNFDRYSSRTRPEMPSTGNDCRRSERRTVAVPWKNAAETRPWTRAPGRSPAPARRGDGSRGEGGLRGIGERGLIKLQLGV